MESENNKDKNKQKPTGSQPVVPHDQEEVSQAVEIQNVISSLP